MRWLVLMLMLLCAFPVHAKRHTPSATPTCTKTAAPFGIKTPVPPPLSDNIGQWR